MPITAERRETRFLSLSPGTWDSEINIRLQVHALNRWELPRYEALSYTWGTSSERRHVCIDDGARMLVTDNLFNALRRLRRKKRERLLWVDAICIN